MLIYEKNLQKIHFSEKCTEIFEIDVKNVKPTLNVVLYENILICLKLYLL